MLLKETLVIGNQLSRLNIVVVRMECAIGLEVVAVDTVIWIVRDRVEIFGARAEGLGVRVRGVDLVAEGAVVGRSVDILSEGLATNQVVKGAVLHDDVDNSLDLFLQVLDRRS